MLPPSVSTCAPCPRNPARWKLFQNFRAATDNPPPASSILLSWDADCSHPLAQLRKWIRNYEASQPPESMDHKRAVCVRPEAPAKPQRSQSDAMPASPDIKPSLHIRKRGMVSKDTDTLVVKELLHDDNASDVSFSDSLSTSLSSPASPGPDSMELPNQFCVPPLINIPMGNASAVANGSVFSFPNFHVPHPTYDMVTYHRALHQSTPNVASVGSVSACMNDSSLFGPGVSQICHEPAKEISFFPNWTNGGPLLGVLGEEAEQWIDEWCKSQLDKNLLSEA